MKPWRAPELPGVNAGLPDQATGLAMSRRQHEKLTKILRTFDNTRTVAELVPYVEASEAWLDACAAQFADINGQMGPAEMAILATSSLQLLWSRLLFDKAAKASGADAAKLAEMASRIADACGKNILTSFTLAERVKGKAPPAPPKDPLDEYL